MEGGERERGGEGKGGWKGVLVRVEGMDEGL